MSMTKQPIKKAKKTAAKPEPAPKISKGGRPTSYKSEYVAQAEKLCKLGATDEDLGDFFGVSRVTIYRWQVRYPDFCNALKVGTDPADERVVRSLYNRAVGYSFKSEKIFHHQGQITRAKTIEFVPPDPTAMIFWLKNRRPAEWRDRQETSLLGPDGGPVRHSVEIHIVDPENDKG